MNEIRTDPAGMAASCLAPIMPLVSGVARACRETIREREVRQVRHFAQSPPGPPALHRDRSLCHGLALDLTEVNLPQVLVDSELKPGCTRGRGSRCAGAIQRR